MSPRIDPIEERRNDPAEKHRKIGLATFDDTPGQRTFSVVAGIADGDNEAPVLLSLDDSITEILERIRNKFRLQRTPNVLVVWRMLNRKEETSTLMEHNLEETLRNLWRRKWNHAMYLISESHKADIESILQGRGWSWTCCSWRLTESRCRAMVSLLRWSGPIRKIAMGLNPLILCIEYHFRRSRP